MTNRIRVFLVDVSVTLFLQGEVVNSTPNPNLEGQGIGFSQDPLQMACPARLNLPSHNSQGSSLQEMYNYIIGMICIIDITDRII